MVLGIYGSGGAGKEVKEIVDELHHWDEIVFIDDMVPADTFKDVKRMPFEQFQNEFNAETAEVVIALGEPKNKIILYNRIKAAGFGLANVIHRTAWVSPTATIGKGVILRAGVVVSADAYIGDNVTILECSHIGHDVIVNDHCQIAGFVIIGGHSEVGEGTYIGLSVPVKEGIKIGRCAVVGMGSVVSRDIPDDVIALGNPARGIRRNDDDSRVFR
ncbi:acetyltransferase [bacterium C-53]|nr:acetyltransferase [Lachnospiraceae bacterium]NBI02665.1 acetyltransferase [Lachnospiraceae bacterium]RKJ11304.1 acetyltransferase [bacterium C-53]